MKQSQDQDTPPPVLRGGHGHLRDHPDPITEALRSEIAFWRDMLEQCDDATENPSFERMQFALELAERKLREWSGS